MSYLEPPSLLILRSNLRVQIFRPWVEIKIPASSDRDRKFSISLYVNNINLVATGLNEFGGEVINGIDVQISCTEAGLYCDDPMFAMFDAQPYSPRSRQTHGGEQLSSTPSGVRRGPESGTYSLVQIVKVLMR